MSKRKNFPMQEPNNAPKIVTLSTPSVIQNGWQENPPALDISLDICRSIEKGSFRTLCSLTRLLYPFELRHSNHCQTAALSKLFKKDTEIDALSSLSLTSHSSRKPSYSIGNTRVWVQNYPPQNG